MNKKSNTIEGLTNHTAKDSRDTAWSNVDLLALAVKSKDTGVFVPLLHETLSNQYIEWAHVQNINKSILEFSEYDDSFITDILDKYEILYTTPEPLLEYTVKIEDFRMFENVIAKHGRKLHCFPELVNVSMRHSQVAFAIKIISKYCINTDMMISLLDPSVMHNHMVVKKILEVCSRIYPGDILLLINDWNADDGRYKDPNLVGMLEEYSEHHHN